MENLDFPKAIEQIDKIVGKLREGNGQKLDFFFFEFEQTFEIKQLNFKPFFWKKRKVGIVGFCMGSVLSMASAVNCINRVDAAAGSFFLWI